MSERIPANGDLDVYVAKNLAEISRKVLTGPFIALVPDRNNWNDYGLGYFAKLYLFDEFDEKFEIHLRIMFKDYERAENALHELIKEHGTVFPIEKVGIPFVSLIPKEYNYRKVIETYGFDNGIAALRKLHDAVVARLEGTDSTLIEMTASENFHIGGLRHENAYTALRRGARHFRSDLPEPIEDSAGHFVFSTKLKSAPNRIDVDFNFSHKPIIRDRIAVLVGRNGVGKTQLLKAMVDGLSKQPDNIENEFFFNPQIKLGRVLVFSSVPTDPFPKTIGAWNGIDYEYFATNAVRENGEDPLIASLVSCRFEDNPLSLDGGITCSRVSLIKRILDPIGLWEKLYLPLRKRKEGDDLPNVVEVDEKSYVWIGQNISELNKLKTFQQIDWKRLPVVLDQNEEIRELSSGEYTMLRFVAQATAAIENGSLLLLDEPETHLHPNYVSELMSVLYQLLKATHSIAVIATHSAYVVREVSRESVKVFSIKDGVLSIETPRLQTFGASIDTISQFVFGDTDTDHHFQSILKKWASDKASEIGLDGIIEQYGTSLNPESLSFIARSLNHDSQKD